ncbi:helix-turn-helix domain-containing protein, partial [Isoptericola sp. NPDC019482]
MARPTPECCERDSGDYSRPDAASRLFYARGLHAVGVDTIAAEAGVTKKT